MMKKLNKSKMLLIEFDCHLKRFETECQEKKARDELNQAWSCGFFQEESSKKSSCFKLSDCISISSRSDDEYELDINEDAEDIKAQYLEKAARSAFLQGRLQSCDREQIANTDFMAHHKTRPGYEQALDMLAAVKRTSSPSIAGSSCYKNSFIKKEECRPTLPIRLK